MCGFVKGKLSGSYQLEIIIFISAGNYSSFNRVNPHVPSLCYRGAYWEGGALEVDLKRDINYSFIPGEGSHRRWHILPHM